MNPPESIDSIASASAEAVAAQPDPSLSSTPDSPTPYVEEKLDIASLLSIRFSRGKRFPDEVIHDALVKCGGNIAAAARFLQTRRSSLKESIDASAELTLLLSELREEVCDQAENNIFTNVFQGDMAASQFVLKTIGRDRGYIPGVALTGTLRTISYEPVMNDKEWSEKYGSADLGTTTGTAESPD